jgi:hypothetical protein
MNPRPRRWSAAVLATLALLALGGLGVIGCGSTRPCKSGTLFISVQFQGTARAADSLLVLVSDGDSPRQSVFPHGPGAAQGTIEVDFPDGYREGRQVDIVLTPQTNGTYATSVATSTILTAGCTTLGMVLSGDGDGGADDAPQATGGASGAGGAGDGGAGGGASGAGGDVTDGSAGATGGGGGAPATDGGAGTTGAGGRSDAGSDGADASCARQTEDCFNGIDDDCNGHIDCDDPACAPSAVCVPPAGAGGFVPGIYVDAAGACPPGFTAAETAINATLSPGAGCTGCSCQGSITCSANVLRYANNLACTTLGAAPTVVGSITSSLATGASTPTASCLAATFTMANPPMVATYVTTNACMPRGTATPSAPTWGTSRKFCRARSVGAGCAGGAVCVPGAAPNHCVLASGALTCPAGYTKDGGSWYTGFSDARTCGACGCGTQTPGSCTNLLASFYAGSTTCAAAVRFSVGSGMKLCAFNTDCQSAGFGGTPTLPTCTAATSTTTGAVTATGEQTLCCF